MEPHCCHCSPAANGETDRPELKLVPFVAPTDASKRVFLTCVGHIDRQRFPRTSFCRRILRSPTP